MSMKLSPDLPISRRALGKLSTAGFLTLACPFNRIYAQNLETQPKRFFAYMSPGGMYLKKWAKAGPNGSIAFGPGVPALEPYADQLVVIGGTNNIVARNTRHHFNGMATALTGAKRGPDPKEPADMRSMDQFIADRRSDDVPFFSLETGFRTVDFVDAKTRLVYAAAKSPKTPNRDPESLFNKLFKGVNAGGAGVPSNSDEAKTRAKKLRVLDRIQEQIGIMKRELVGDDKETLDAHLDTIRQLEQRIENQVTNSVPGACEPPTIGNNPGKIEEANILMDITAQAFICGLTNVATYQINWASPRLVYDFLPGQVAYGEKFHHEITHTEPMNSPQADTFLTQVDDFHSKLFARILKALQERPEPHGKGSMLDNTVMLWLTPITRPESHSHKNMHWMLAGGKELGLWETNRFHNVNGEPLHNMHVSIMQRFGFDINSFGAPEASSGRSSVLG